MFELAGITIFPFVSMTKPVNPPLSNKVIMTVEPTVIGVPFKLSGATPFEGNIFPTIPPISFAVIVSSSAIICPLTVMNTVAVSQFEATATSQIW